MPEVGSAWYEVDARIDKLRSRLDDADRRVMGSVSKAERGFGGRVTRAIGGMGSALLGVAKSAAVVGGVGLLGLGALGGMAIKSAADMESMQGQWETLLGSTEKAKDRMEELRTFAATTPFEIPEVMAASRQLQVFGGTALATGDNLRLVGDIASGTQQPFTDVAMWIGRTYDAMKSGQPFGEAAMRLQEMGALSGEGRRELEKLSVGVKDGSITMDQAWKKSKGIFSQFSGGMERQSKTLNGQLSNLMDNIGQTLAGVGAMLLPMAKDIVAGFNEALPTIRAVLIDVFERAGPIIMAIAGVVRQVIDVIAQAFADGGDSSSGFGAVVETVGKVVGDVIDAWVKAWPTVQEIIVRVMTIAQQVIGTVVPIIGQAITWIVQEVLPPLLEAFNAVAAWVSDHWPQIAAIIEKAAGIVGSVIAALWPIIEQIARVALPILGAAFEVLMPILDVLLTVVQGVIDFFTGTFMPAIETVGRGFAAVWQAVSGLFTAIWNGMLQAVGQIVGTMIGIIKNVVGIAAEIPGPWQEGAKEQKAALEGMEAAAKSWGKETVSTLGTTFDQQLAIARAGGRGTAGAYADGFTDMEPFLTGAVLQYVGKASRILAAQSPPKYGPLKDIDKFGERTADAYAEGWARRAGNLRRVIGDTIGGMQPRASAPVGASAGAGAVAGGSTTIQISLPSMLPYSPAQAQAAIRAIIPELVPVLRRQRVIR